MERYLFKSHFVVHRAWSMLILALALVALFLLGVAPGEARTSSPVVHEQTLKLEGTIDELPAEGIEGIWVVAGHSIAVDENTQILDQHGEIAVGATVVVHTQLDPKGVLQASLIRVTQGNKNDDDDDEEEWEAIVLETPGTANGLGDWRVRTDRDQTWWVTVNAETSISHPLPQKGQWVEIEGTLLQGNKILAHKFRSDDYETSEVIVRIQEDVTIEMVADRYDLSVTRRLLQSVDIYLLASKDDDDDDDDDEEDLVTRLHNDDDVLWAELNYMGEVPVADPYQIWKWGGTDPQGYENQFAFDQVALPPVQPFHKGNGVIVAVLDTGISLNHPAFQDRLIPGHDWVNDDADPTDEGSGLAWGHGTHVAGIITQIAPNSKILPVRVLDANGRGDIFIVAAAIEWAVAQGADVINLSLGTEYDSKVLSTIVEEATAAGVVIVAAAGNEGGDTPQYPAAYPQTLAVTAVDAANQKADFANYSHWVDIAAPGVGITSTITGPEGDGYASWSGTSMATPFVSGVAALSRGKDWTASSAAIRQQLIENAVNIDSVNPDYQDQMGSLLNAVGVLGAPVRIYVPMVNKE
jgi:thermitase